MDFSDQSISDEPVSTTLPGKLDQTILALIQAWVATPADFIGRQFFKLIKKQGATNVTSIIVQGIKNAGLYEVLNRSDFTLHDLYKAAQCRINHQMGAGKVGIYLRDQKSSIDVQHWDPDTWYTYVGYTLVDFAQQYIAHQNGNHQYAILNRSSTILQSFALCVLDESVPHEVYYVARQVFVCLLGTYKASVLQVLVEKKGFKGIENVFAATNFDQIATDVFQSTQWIIPLRGHDSTAINGANYYSPLETLGTAEERVFFLRKDCLKLEAETAVEVAEFRRQGPLRTQYSGNQQGSKQFQVFSLEGIKSTGEVKNLIKFNLSEPQDPSDGPDPETPCQFVIEVRLDGKPHPSAWARLPFVGGFENWEQANSFAVKVEYEHPRGSGNWKYRYIRYGGALLTMMDRDTPGLLRRYAQAIGFLVWLFNVRNLVIPQWMQLPIGRARVLQILLDKTTTGNYLDFGPVIKPIELLPSTKRFGDEIFGLMKKHGVGRTLAALPACHHRRCDFCLVLDIQGNRQGYQGPCESAGPDNLCTNCKRRGLPYCSYTEKMLSAQNFRFKQSTGRLTLEEREVFIRVCHAFTANRHASESQKVKKFVGWDKNYIVLDFDELPEDSDDERE